METPLPAPSNTDLDQIDAEIEAAVAAPAAWDDPLEALFEDAQRHAKPKQKKAKVLSAAQSADAALRQLRELYTKPENWERVAGVALIDAKSGVLIGNFSDYRHISDRSARKLIREHQPIEVSHAEEIEGYMGVEAEARYAARTWDEEHTIIVGLQLDELQVECPAAELLVCCRFKGIVRAALVADTQLACPSGNVILQLPAGTDVWLACSTDTKVRIRKELPL